MTVRLSALRASRPSHLLDAESTTELVGLGQLKNPITSSGIEPATFRLIAECLNQLCYRMLPTVGEVFPQKHAKFS
jgi:hypothetical protein